jgi:hypothetical protein
MTVQKINSDVAQGMRWSARGLGLLGGSLFMQFVFGSGARVIPALSWSRPEEMPLMMALAVAVAGGLIGWRWEAIGGAMALVSSGVTISLTYIGSGSERLILALVLTLPLLVAGSMYLACWRTRMADFHRERAQQAIQTEGNSAIAALRMHS